MEEYWKYGLQPKKRLEITIEIIKEGAFGGTYFRNIYSGINKKWNKKSWKEFVQLKNIDARFMHQVIMM